MNRRYSLTTLAAAAFLASVLAPAPAHAQLWSWTKDQLTEYTKAWTGERMPDGRPKVSDALIERAKGLSMEEITINWGAGGAPVDRNLLHGETLGPLNQGVGNLRPPIWHPFTGPGLRVLGELVFGPAPQLRVSGRGSEYGREERGRREGGQTVSAIHSS